MGHCKESSFITTLQSLTDYLAKNARDDYTLLYSFSKLGIPKGLKKQNRLR